VIVSAGSDCSLRIFSTIQDQQSRELSQGHLKKAAKKLRTNESLLKLPSISQFDSCTHLLLFTHVHLSGCDQVLPVSVVKHPLRNKTGTIWFRSVKKRLSLDPGVRTATSWASTPSVSLIQSLYPQYVQMRDEQIAAATPSTHSAWWCWF